jgi:Retrotransposon gag protein
VPELNKTLQAAVNFKGEAASWYRGYRSINEHPNWPKLIDLVKIRFSKAEGISAYEEMKRLFQNGTIRDYMKLCYSDTSPNSPNKYRIRDRYGCVSDTVRVHI